MGVYTIRVTEGEKDLILDALRATGADVGAETFARAVLAQALRDLTALRPSDARLAVAGAVKALRDLEAA